MSIRLSRDLELPLDAVTRTFGIFGQRETGKSTTAAVMVEGMVRGGARAAVLDPTGVWYGLTREGSKPGLPGVVLGGEHADAPLEPHAGALVAEFVIGSDYPLVILDMKLLRKHQRQHFAMEFLEALYHDNRDPLMVVFDEAAQFAPTHMREGGDVPRLLGAVEDLVKLGRSRGLGATMIEQRIATLNANVREQISTLVAHRLIGPLDRKALKEWVAAQGEPGREAEALGTISKLDPGRALVWSPAWIKFFGVVTMNNATTFDSRATPEVGKRRAQPGKRAPVDLDTLRVKMAASIEQAEANDPKKLHGEIARLRRELEARPQIDPQPVEIEVEKVVEVPVLTDEDREKLAHIAKAIDGLSEQARNVADVAGTLVAAVEAREPVAKPAGGRPPLPIPTPPPPVPPPPREQIREAIRRNRQDEQRAESNGKITSSYQRVLDALAWYEEIGIRDPTRHQVGFVASYKIGGRFNNVVTEMKRDGLLDYTGGGKLSLTDAGRRHALYPNLPRTNEALQGAVLDRLTPSQAKILAVLIDVRLGLERADLARATGYEVGGRFNNLVTELKSLGLVEYPSQGWVAARHVLFPLG